MRVLTTILIAGAIVLVVVVGLLVRSEQGDAPVGSAESRRGTMEKSAADQLPRSARVEQRLQRLRENNEPRSGASAAGRAPEAGAIAPRPEMRSDTHPVLPTAKAGQPGGEEDAALDDDEVQLVETIRTSPDPEERASAVFFLSGGEGRAVLPVLLEALGDPDPEVRLAVIEALDEYSDEINPDVLTPALNDSSAEVRFEALGIVGDMDDDERGRALARRMLNDPDDDVRALAEGIIEMEDQ